MVDFFFSLSNKMYNLLRGDPYENVRYAEPVDNFFVVVELEDSWKYEESYESRELLDFPPYSLQINCKIILLSALRLFWFIQISRPKFRALISLPYSISYPFNLSIIMILAEKYELWISALFNPLNTKRRLLYLKTHFVPRSKHFSFRL